MKAHVDAKELANALGTVAPFAARHGALPALTMTHLEVADGRLHLVAGNVDTWCRTSIAAGLDATGGVALAPTAFLAKAAARFDGQVAVDLSDGDLVLATSRTQVSMPVGDSDSYPRIAWPTTHPTPFDAEVWARIQRVLHAASHDTARPTLGLLDVADGWAACTDSYRLAATEVPDDLALQLPADFVARVAKLLGDQVATVVDDRTIVFTDGTTSLQARTSTDDYPNWKGLIPPPSALHWSFTVATEPLFDALRLADVVADLDRRIPAIFRNVDGVLEVTAREQDAGTVRTEVPAEVDGNWPDRIGVNPGFLRDAVAATGADTVTVRGTDAQRPIVVDGGGLTQIVMPVRVS